MIRRNGIVRVPKLWLEATVEAFDTLAYKTKSGSSLVVPLPLKVFPYPKIREALLAIYPEKFVPLTVVVSAGPGLGGGAAGATSTKKSGGYTVTLSFMLKGAKAVSTILHELRHVVQHLGDEVVKTASGTFGRPSRVATASLRARKKAIKSGKIQAVHKSQSYFTSASEWQPWVGSTADKIVGTILDGKLTTTKEVNDAIRTGIVNSTFYTLTDPATRKELMRQVYTEVVRQLKGYSDIVPAKHPKALKHAKDEAYGKKMEAAVIQQVSSVLSKWPSKASVMSQDEFLAKAAAGTLKPSAPKSSTSASTYAVRVKIEGASAAIAKEATYAGKDSKGRDKLEVPAADKDAALLAAGHFADFAKQGSTLYGGTIYAVRIAHGGKESEVYVAGAKGAAASAVAPEPGYIYVDKDALKAAKAQAKAYEAAKKKAKAAAKAPQGSILGSILKAAIASGKITPQQAVATMIDKTIGASKTPKKPYIIKWGSPYEAIGGPSVVGSATLSDGSKIHYRIKGKGYSDPSSTAFTKSAEFHLAVNLGESKEESSYGFKVHIYPNKLGVYTKVGAARKAAEADALARGAVMQGVQSNPRRTRRTPRRRTR